MRLSFEFFPPKTPVTEKILLSTATSLADKNPDFFSVTFGAGGSTRDGTFETVKSLQQNTNIPLVPHLSCIGVNKKDLVEILNQYKALGIKRLVALRGDLPSGMVAKGKVKFAHHLVKLIRDVTGNYFHIDVAAYPECHPEAKTAIHDVISLKKKFEMGANSAITQYFFNSDAYFYFLDECARQHIPIPIVPGIMPITQFNKLIRFSSVCGAEIPRWLYKRLDSYGNDAESIKAFGVEVVYNLCSRLLAGGAPGLHFFTLNQAETSLRILDIFNINVPKIGRTREPVLGVVK